MQRIIKKKISFFNASFDHNDFTLLVQRMNFNDSKQQPGSEEAEIRKRMTSFYF